MTLDLIAEFMVPGEPLPKARPRFGKGRAYTAKRTVLAENNIIDTFDHACPLWEPVIDDIALEVDFHRTNRRRADWDNLAKLLTDALNGIAYADDKQIVDGRVRVFYGAKHMARTEVRIYLIKEDT